MDSDSDEDNLPDIEDLSLSEGEQSNDDNNNNNNNDERRKSNTEFDFDIGDITDINGDTEANNLDNSFYQLMEEEGRRQSISNFTSNKPKIAKLPSSLRDILNPNEMISVMDQNGIDILHDIPIVVPSVKSAEEIQFDLDELLRDLLQKISNRMPINYNNYSDIMVSVIPFNSPDLQFDVTELPIEETDLIIQSSYDKTSTIIHPYRVIEHIIKHAIKFTYFKNLNFNLISDHIYLNFFETNRDYLTMTLTYAPVIGNVSEWVKNVMIWKSQGLSNILIDALNITGTIDTIVNFLIFIAIMYSRTHSAYKELGKNDLIQFWNLPLQDRQLNVLQNRPQEISQRFTFKYKSIFAVVPWPLEQPTDDQLDLVDRRKQKKNTNQPTKTTQPPALPQQLPRTIPIPVPYIPTTSLNTPPRTSPRTTPYHTSPQTTPPRTSPRTTPHHSSPQTIPPLPVTPTIPITKPITTLPKDKRIYYTYQMEALIDKLKIITVMLFMKQDKQTSTLIYTSDVNQSLGNWIIKTNLLLRKCESENISDVNVSGKYLHALYVIVESLYMSWQ